METLKEKLLNGKFNGTIYANNTIYISGEKLESVDLNELLKATAEIYSDNLNDSQKERFTELISFINFDVDKNDYEKAKREVALSFNWAKTKLGSSYSSFNDLFNKKIKQK